MTYLFLQCNSDRSHFLHFLHLYQAQCMLEIWMDHDNKAKVRLVQWTVEVAFESLTYPLSRCNSDRSHFLLFLHLRQARSMLEIWMDRKIMRQTLQLRQVKSTIWITTYPLLQYNSVLWLMIHFLPLAQDQRMLEIWMDHDNNTKVRIVEDKSYQHLKEWLTLFSYAALATHTSYISIFAKIIAC